MATLADQLIGNLLNAGGLIGNSFAQGREREQNFQLGQQQLAIRQAQLSAVQQEQRRAAEQQQRYQSDITAYLADPTPMARATILARYPEQADAFKKSIDELDGPAKQSLELQLWTLHNAAKNNRPDTVLRTVEGLIKADKAAGHDVANWEELRTRLISSNGAERDEVVKEIMGTAGLALSASDPAKAKALGLLADNENHVGQLGNGGLFDMRTGQVLREPDPDWQFDPNSGSWLQKPGSGGSKGGGPASGSGAADGNFDTFHSRFLAPIEGGYAASDGRSGAPVNFGVNQKANPDVDVKNLTPERAKSILRERYWKASGADKLPPGLAEVHGDTAVNAGVGKARELLKQSRGDVNRYLDLREQHYRSLGGRELPVWLDRNEKLRRYVSGSGGGGSPGVVQVLPPKDRDAPSGYRWKSDGSLEPIPGGPGAGRPGGDRKAEADLRKEFDRLPEIKSFKAIRTSFNQIRRLAKNPSPQNDIALIFSYMKMLDPDSVVREGEFATAQNAAGVPDQIRNAWNKALSGERLNQQQRGQMLKSALDVYTAQRETYNAKALQYRDYAKDYEVNPDHVARRYIPDAQRRQPAPTGFRILRVRPKQ